MSLPKNLKSWVTNFLICLVFFLPALTIAQEGAKEVKVINDRILVMDGKNYGYLPEEKYRKLLKDAKKKQNLEKQLELEKQKNKALQDTIDSQKLIIKDERRFNDTMVKTFDKLPINQEPSFWESDTVRIISTTGFFVLGAYIQTKMD